MPKRRFSLTPPIEATGSVISHGAITITNVATAIPTTPLQERKAISVRNWSNNITVYLGGAGVTVANGYPLQPYESLPLEVGQGLFLYGIVASGTAEVRYMEIDQGI